MRCNAGYREPSSTRSASSDNSSIEVAIPYPCSGPRRLRTVKTNKSSAVWAEFGLDNRYTPIARHSDLILALFQMKGNGRQGNLSDVDFVHPYESARIVNPFPSQYGPNIPGADATFTLPVSIRWYFRNDFRTSQLATWNLGLERQLGQDWVLSAAYNGNKGTHLSSGAKNYRETNPAIYIPGNSTESNTQQRRFYQDFSSIGLYSSDNNSNHNSLQLGVQKRFGKGLYILANFVRGPRFFNADLGAIKTTAITERVSLQFRAEFFNIFNNVNFNYQDAVVTDSTFGQITSTASGPRILQFALKLAF